MSSAPDDIRRIEALLRANRAPEAAREAARALLAAPRVPALHLLMARAAQALGDFRTMLGAARTLCALEESREARLLLIESLLLHGDKREARERLASERMLADNEPRALMRVAEFLGQCVDHAAALACYRRAQALAPDDTAVLYSLAASLVANGELLEGEQVYQRLLALDPADADGWYNRATVRRQSRENNHVDALRARLHALAPGARQEVALCYALAKELEDLGDYGQSFAYLQRGAQARRKRLRYEVQTDVDAMLRLEQVFSPGLLAAAEPATPERGPLFVLGLPRSGTTLVERILAAHPAVESLGEVNDFALALINTLGRSDTKLALIEQSARADFSRMGANYLHATRGYGKSAQLLVDKTPLNFLYLGLIRLALPGARVVHLRRDPMDGCFAMYKTLFRMGYPFSYDLEDLARYHVAYSRLMQHWRATLPGFILDLDYETLVSEPRAATEALLRFCGLPWDERCLHFHSQGGAAATASAAQVREPIHERSVGRWRRNAAELAPLEELLRRAARQEPRA
jgi:tetratricopeptide (TPR) repeat protein